MNKITANDPISQSPDVTAENLARLRALFPELVTEGANGVAVNLDVLKQLVGDKVVADTEEKYGLNWHGKRRARQLALTPSAGTLRPCPEDSVDWETTKNLMIEGDNLEVLKLLQKSYAGVIDFIYIDPPYNTGKDFIYPDNFKDNIKNYLELTGQTEGGKSLSANTETNGRFHTEWLNMMYPRLKLARNLLRKSGVILISIDDHEIASTTGLLNEIFGEENFICKFVWKSKGSGAYDSDLIVSEHEYIVCYARDSNEVMINKKDYDTEGDAAYSHVDEKIKTGGKYKRQALAMGSLQYSASLDYEVTCPDGTKMFPGKRFGPPFIWRYGQEKLKWALDNKFAEFVLTKNGWSLYSKQYEHLDSNGDSIKRQVPYSTLGLSALNRRGTELLKELFDGERIFDYPKPVDVMLDLLRIFTRPNSSVMDFFSGSATTAHSVIMQNEEDSGTRRYITVQIPEPTDAGSEARKAGYKNIFSIGCERIRRVLQNIQLLSDTKSAGSQTVFPTPVASSSRSDLGFRVFKLASSNIRTWEPDSDKLEETLFTSIDHLKADRTESDILYELLLKLGLDLCVPIERKQVAGTAKQPHDLHAIGGGSLFVCLSPVIPQADVEPLALGLVAWHKELKPAGETTIVFRDSAFADDVAKTNLTAILQQHGLTTVRSL